METTTEHDKRRIVERLTMAQFSVKSAYDSLLSAGVFAHGDKESLLQMQMLQFNTRDLLGQIERVLTKHCEEQG